MCSHTLAAGDENPYVNVVTAKTTTGKEKPSEQALHDALPIFTIEKEQRVKGEAAFTKAKLTAKVGEVVEYKITVKNTGGTTLEFEPLSDPKCSGAEPRGKEP